MKKGIISIFAFGFIGIMVFLGTNVFSALAQTPTPSSLEVPSDSPPAGINLNISTTFLNLRTDPGKTVSSEFRVRNNNSFDEYLTLSLVKYINSLAGTPVI